MTEILSPSEQIVSYRGARQRLLRPPALLEREIARLERRNEQLTAELAAAVEAREIATNAAQVLFFALATRLVQQRTVGSPVRVRKIIAETARVYSVTPLDILGHKREPRFIQPRWVAIYLLRTLTNRPWAQLGRDMGRDHSTLWYAYNKVADRLASDPEFAATVAEIRKAVETP